MSLKSPWTKALAIGAIGVVGVVAAFKGQWEVVTAVTTGFFALLNLDT